MSRPALSARVLGWWPGMAARFLARRVGGSLLGREGAAAAVLLASVFAMPAGIAVAVPLAIGEWLVRR